MADEVAEASRECSARLLADGLKNIKVLRDLKIKMSRSQHWETIRPPPSGIKDKSLGDVCTYIQGLYRQSKLADGKSRLI